VVDVPASPPEPEPEAPKTPPPKPKGSSRLRREPVAAAPSGGAGKAIVAIILFLLPAVGAGVFWKLRSGAMKNLMVKLGTFGAKGLHKLYLKLSGKAAPAPPPEEEKEEKKDESSTAPKPDPAADKAEREADEKKITRTWEELNLQKRKLRERETGDPDNPELEPWRKRVKELEEELERLQTAYAKAFGQRYKLE
jgi:hypothetical protein